MNTDRIAAVTRPRRPGTTPIAATVILLALGYGAVSLTFDFLAPRLPGGPQQLHGRMRWYFQHRQLQPDIRTLAAMLTYVLEPEPRPAGDAALPSARQTGARTRTPGEVQAPPGVRRPGDPRNARCAA